LLEAETGVSFARLGESLGLSPAPWREPPTEVPDGPDVAAWSLATAMSPPPRDPNLPQDANARAGMQGHAGFGTFSLQLREALARWVGSGWPDRMAVPTAEGENGTLWGMGLQVAFTGGGRFGQLLSRISSRIGVQVLEEGTEAIPLTAPVLDAQTGPPSGWWFHLGYTGPALFYRPSDQSCLSLLLHRKGPGGKLLDAEALRARRWALLARFVGQSRG
jgi:hypothetical protein